MEDLAHTIYRLIFDGRLAEAPLRDPEHALDSEFPPWITCFVFYVNNNRTQLGQAQVFGLCNLVITLPLRIPTQVDVNRSHFLMHLYCSRG